MWGMSPAMYTDVKCICKQKLQWIPVKPIERSILRSCPATHYSSDLITLALSRPTFYKGQVFWGFHTEQFQLGPQTVPLKAASPVNQ